MAKYIEMLRRGERLERANLGAMEEEARMKFMLLQAYGGIERDVPPMSEWTPEAIEAHIHKQAARLRQGRDHRR